MAAGYFVDRHFGFRTGNGVQFGHVSFPCLIPYEELPELEKDYDRDTALGTLTLISKLGFKIIKEPL